MRRARVRSASLAACAGSVSARRFGRRRAQMPACPAGYTRTGFDAKAIQPDAPLPIYAVQRHVFDGVMARAMTDGDDPAIVARAIVAAATDAKPKLRYTAGPTAGRVSALRRFVPTRVFDRQIRKLNRLPA